MPLSPAWPTERCSSVAYSGWKKNRDQLHSMLVSSEVPESIPPFHGALRASFIAEEKLAGEALRSARGSSGNLADFPLVKGDAPCSEVPACPLQVLTGSAWRVACLVHLLTCLCSEQAKCGTVNAMMVRLGSLRIPSGGVSVRSLTIKCYPSLRKSAARRVPRGHPAAGAPGTPSRVCRE